MNDAEDCGTPMKGCRTSMEGLVPSGASIDTTAAVLEAFAIAERRRNFYFLGRYSHKYMNGEDFSVRPSLPERQKWAINRWHLDAAELAQCDWYTFRQHISALADTVPLRHIPAPDVTADVHVDRIEVFDVDDTRSWMPVVAWMKKKFEWHDAYEQALTEFQNENQVTWWQRNGRPFRLLHLPRELREAVYLEIVGPVILPKTRGVREDTANMSSIVLGNGMRYGAKDRRGAKLDPDIDRPNLKFLRVNRQVYKEATKAVWDLATKRFHVASRANLLETNPNTGRAPLILRIRELAPPLALQRVQLEFTAECYFELIGIRPEHGAPLKEFTPAPGAVSLATLKSMPIKHLDFRFMSSKHEKAACPWGLLSAQNSAKPPVHSCQKTWIDWFFTFAYEQLLEGNFKTITVSGCIKDSTRAKWEPMLNLKDKRFAMDTTDAKAAIRKAKQDTLPLPCKCSVPCYQVPVGANGAAVRFNASDVRAIPGLQQAVQDNVSVIPGLRQAIQQAIQDNYFSFAD